MATLLQSSDQRMDLITHRNDSWGVLGVVFGLAGGAAALMLFIVLGISYTA